MSLSDLLTQTPQMRVASHLRGLVQDGEAIIQLITKETTQLRFHRFQRWKNRATVYIQKEISDYESNRFWKLSELPSAMFKDGSLNYTLRNHIGFLTALADEVAQHPEILRQVQIRAVAEPANAPLTIVAQGTVGRAEMTANDGTAVPEKNAQATGVDVFIVHGRNEAIRADFFSFLRALKLNPLEWSEVTALTGKASPYIGEILDAAFSRAQAVVVLLTGDDEAKLRDEFVAAYETASEGILKKQPRPNVLFEAGMAFGRNADRTLIVQVGEVKEFSDVAGRHRVILDNSVERRKEVAQRLTSAGCAVDMSGVDWMKVGKFDVA